MPKGSKVEEVYRALRDEGKSKESAARIAQAQTGLALATGKPPKGNENMASQSKEYMDGYRDAIDGAQPKGRKGDYGAGYRYGESALRGDAPKIKNSSWIEKGARVKWVAPDGTTMTGVVTFSFMDGVLHVQPDKRGAEVVVVKRNQLVNSFSNGRMRAENALGTKMAAAGIQNAFMDFEKKSITMPNGDRYDLKIDKENGETVIWYGAASKGRYPSEADAMKAIKTGKFKNERIQNGYYDIFMDKPFEGKTFLKGGFRTKEQASAYMKQLQQQRPADANFMYVIYK